MSPDQASLDFAKELEAEIQSRQSFLDKTMPNDFAFTILDDGDDPYDPWAFGDRRKTNDRISLRREFDGEKIKVRVRMPHFSSDSDRDSYSGGFGRRRSGAKKSDPDPLKLVVKIFKRRGRKSSFKVGAVAGNVTVKSMKVKVPSDEEYSYLSDPEEYIVDKKGGLQRALREYLKVRGIEKSTTDFLYEYMLRKSNTQPTIVLQKVLKFLKD